MSTRLLSKRSNDALAGVSHDLVKVVVRALELSAQDFMVLEGVRKERRQHELYGQGRTAEELRAVGVDPSLARPSLKPVTWTLKSKHFVQEDGCGHAVDLVPYPLDWNTISKFDAIADAMMQAADELGVKIRHGADWDMDGKRREKGESDSPHYELA